MNVEKASLLPRARRMQNRERVFCDYIAKVYVLGLAGTNIL